MVFISKHEVPFITKKVTYGKHVCDINPDKVETHRTRLTVGGNLLDYAGVMSTPTETVTTRNCLLNSIVYNINDQCLNVDTDNFYLNNDLPDPEYMKIHISIIPEEVIEAYNCFTLQDKNGSVYMRICKGMHGLKQAGIISNLELQKNMAKFGYCPVFFHSRSMVAWSQRQHLYIISRQFLRQVYVQGQHRTFLEFPPEKILLHSW